MQVPAAAAAKSLQSCLTLCDPTDSSPWGSTVPEILQARTLGWVAISFSNAWKWKVKVKLLSRVWLLATPWTVAHQAPPSMGFSRQECWSGVPLPSPWKSLVPLICKEQSQVNKKRTTSIKMGKELVIFQRHTNGWYEIVSFGQILSSQNTSCYMGLG